MARDLHTQQYRHGSYSNISRQTDRQTGLPIGNLTSQIFANIYLNEFDQFVLHSLKPWGYVRYGDDFVLWLPDEYRARQTQVIGSQFLYDELKLRINARHDLIQPVRQRLAYLGVDIWPEGVRLQKRTQKRIAYSLNTSSAASYFALTKQYLPPRYHKRLARNLLDIIDKQ